MYDPAPSRGHSAQWQLPASWSPWTATLTDAPAEPLPPAGGRRRTYRRRVAHLELLRGVLSLDLCYPGRFRWWWELGGEFSRLGFSQSLSPDRLSLADFSEAESPAQQAQSPLGEGWTAKPVWESALPALRSPEFSSQGEFTRLETPSSCQPGIPWGGGWERTSVPGGREWPRVPLGLG